MRAAALALAVTACEADAPASLPPVSLSIPLHTEVLSNGLTLAVLPDRSVPLVHVAISVRTGSNSEDAATHGYSHLFEHMIFLGSEAVPDAATFRERGNFLAPLSNAYTNVDEVTYYFTADRDHLSEALALFGGSLQAPALLEAELSREKQVVQSEIDLRESEFDFLRWRRAMQALFGEESRRVVPLGSRESVATATQELLRRAHSAYYVPSNTALIFSGDITPDEARAQASAQFGAWITSPAAMPLASRPLQGAPSSQLVVMDAPISTTEIVIAYRGPTESEDPRAVLAGKLLSRITFQRDHEFRALVNAGAHRATFDVQATRDAGWILLELSVPQGSEHVVVAKLRGVLAELATRADVSAAQLEEAKDELFQRTLAETTRPRDRALRLARFWSRSSLTAAQSYLDDVYAIDERDLQRFVARYLRGQPRVQLVMASPDHLRRVLPEQLFWSLGP